MDFLTKRQTKDFIACLRLKVIPLEMVASNDNISNRYLEWMMQAISVRNYIAETYGYAATYNTLGHYRHDHVIHVNKEDIMSPEEVGRLIRAADVHSGLTTYVDIFWKLLAMANSTDEVRKYLYLQAEAIAIFMNLNNVGIKNVH